MIVDEKVDAFDRPEESKNQKQLEKQNLQLISILVKNK